jgi:hypothetical protein
MARPPSFPVLFDHALQIHISDLQNWGYLIPSQIKKGTLAWSVSGKQIGSISISTNTCSKDAFLDLAYNYKEEYRSYSIGLMTLPSNLGKGRVWYFICPVTGKRCRILYMIAGYFLHRDAFPGCMYECQTRSKKDRAFEKEIGWCLVMDLLYDQLNARNFKSHYAGKPTKRYLRLMNKFHEIFPVENPRYGAVKFSENYLQKRYAEFFII